MEKFDVIVVGGGPAGLSAAISAAKRGMKTLVIERGDYPGTKNMMGGILYSRPTESVVPEFWEGAPLERPIIERRYGFLSGDEFISASYRNPAWGEPPYNVHSVLRVKFDRWLAQKAEEVGVMIITETVVDDLLYEGDSVIGVRTGRTAGDLEARVVILAEGVNNFVAQKAGLAHTLRPDSVAIGVKEIIALPREKIEDRFCLEPGQGATIELFGDSTDGMMGNAFIYTNKDSLSIGLGVMLDAMIQTRWTPNDLLESFKAKPYVKRLLQGGETKEYLAHLLPEGGYRQIPRLYRQGVLVAGDTAMFVNGLHGEGSNLAMISGQVAGEVAAQAIQDGNTGEQALSVYAERLKNSFVIKDLYKYRNLGRFFEENPHMLKTYPEILTNSVRLFFTVDGVPKKERQKQIVKSVLAKRSAKELLKDVWEMWRVIK